jgi:Protein of unknown function (DUF3892)
VADTAHIKCINRTEKMSPHERITHVWGYLSSQWKMTLNDAISKIESGEWAFFVRANRRSWSYCSRQSLRQKVFED